MVEETRHIYTGADSMITALGESEATLEAIASGQGGLRYDEHLKVTAGLIDNRLPEAAEMEGYSRFESLVIRQTEKVCGISGIDLSDPGVQIFLSTTKGNVESLEKDPRHIDPDAFLHESAVRISGYLKAANAPVVISNACISGLSAFTVARNMLLDRKIDHAVIVGCDVLSEFIVQGFLSFRSISERPCRPYDASRDGLSLGEACGAILLTTDRKYARSPIVELCGCAVTNDANHISGPSRTGDGLYYAIDSALRQAGIGPEDIDFINTHGTATAYNDEMESKAVHWANLSETPLNSVKGYIGHTLGASGVIETLLCLYELRHNFLFGTLGFRQPGTPCPVNVCRTHRTVPEGLVNCLKTASGFGGCNAAIVLRKEDNPKILPLQRDRTSCTAAAYTLPEGRHPFSEFIRDEFRSLAETNLKFYKMSDLSKALYISAAHLLKEYPAFNDIEPRRKAIIVSNRSSSLEADCRHQEIVNMHKPEGASPAVFVYTLPNVATGEICIRHRLQGDNTFFIEDRDSGLSERYARMLVEYGLADAAICGWCDKLEEDWKVELKIITYK